ncbi:MAG: CCA tRNA nucleotidyltransferase [Candidatus Micrarchaeia archaeon]
MDPAKEKKLKQIFEHVLKEIKPDELEIKSTIAHANEIISRLKEVVPKDVELRVVGSIARSTNLSGDSDIDIFMLFSKKYSEEELERLGLDYAKRIIDKKKNESYEIKYAEHPYTRLYLNDINLKIDIVPAYKISNIEEMGTTVDRSPLHTDYLNEHLTDRQRDDIRVLKFLLKQHNIYGAEVTVKGFSGYLCELLVLTFGSLTKLLEEAPKFKLPMAIIPDEKKVFHDEALAKRFNSRFVVIDPVDKNRNVAAGLSIESLAKFVLVARELIENPRLDLFYKKGFSSEDAPRLIKNFEKESGLRPVLIVVGVPNKSEDIIWPQLDKAGRIIISMVEKNGLSVYLYNVWVKGRQGFLLYYLPNDLSRSKLAKGPDVFAGEYSGSFIKKHRNSFGLFVKESILYSIDKRGHYLEIISKLMKRKELNSSSDIKMKDAKIFDKIPKRYAEDSYAALLETTSL